MTSLHYSWVVVVNAAAPEDVHYKDSCLSVAYKTLSLWYCQVKFVLNWHLIGA